MLFEHSYAFIGNESGKLCQFLCAFFEPNTWFAFNCYIHKVNLSNVRTRMSENDGLVYIEALSQYNISLYRCYVICRNVYKYIIEICIVLNKFSRCIWITWADNYHHISASLTALSLRRGSSQWSCFLHPNGRLTAPSPRHAHVASVRQNNRMPNTIPNIVT